MADPRGAPASDSTRALAAIMFSDVADYTRIMGHDERKAIRIVAEHREILQHQVPRFGGRIIGDAGDGTLSSFPSAVEAVNCARQVQESLKDNSEFSVRIGIHSGDVVFADGNVLGDGVNIASRIYALAPRGGICISGRVYDEIRNQPGIAVQDLGEQRLKHVERPVHVYLLTVGHRSLAQRVFATRPVMTLRRHVVGIVVGLGLVVAFGYMFFTDITTATLVYLPRFLPHLHQKVGYCTTSDGVRIAYATVGKGPPLVIVAGWNTDIDVGLLSPTYSGQFLKLVAAHHLAVQYDGRGFGKSDRGVRDYSIDARVRDIEAVVNALGLKKFAVFGISVEGFAAIAYTARHPDRVTRLILQEAVTKWDASALDPQSRERLTALYSLAIPNWENPAFREMIISLAIPDANPILRSFVVKMNLMSSTPEVVQAFFAESAKIDVTSEAKQIRVPTLILHVRGDQLIPLVLAKQTAELIPGSRLVIIEGRDHIPIPGDGEAEQITRVVGPFFDQDVAERSEAPQP
jgi:class 3 adenylate cyclase/pimeloyl-ACP methyl ester carboxylesterase